jgi:polysaccharide biosynthesis protein PslH
MSSLVVSSYTPTLGSGRAQRTYGIVRALASNEPVDLLYVQFGASTPDRAYAMLKDVRLHKVVSSRGASRAFAYLRARRFGAPPAVARGVSRELAAAARNLAAAPRRSRVIADDLTAAVALAQMAKRSPVIYSAHNLESAFRGDINGDWGSRTGLATFERRVLHLVAESWMPSRLDLEGAAALAPGVRLRLVPNTVDVAAVTPLDDAAGRPVAIMVADFTYSPNRQGLDFLLGAVLPRVWNVVPEFRLSVVGRGLNSAPSADPRVVFTGFVPDLAAAYASAGLAVVPLLTGGGSPLKFIEALAYGMPVVATPRAAAGLEVTAGEHYFEGAGPESFAAAIVAALDRSRARRVAARGRALAEREYSIESLARQLAR